MSTTTDPSYRQAAIVGGLVMGALSALPIISVGNACCCLWVVSGGLVAAYVFQQNHPAPMTAAEGALAGLLAGLVGALVYVVISIPLTLIVAPFERAMAERVLEMSGSMPSDMRDMLDRLAGNRTQLGIGFRVLATLASFVFALFIGAIFSTLGGLLGAALFAKKLPPGTIDVTPSSST